MTAYPHAQPPLGGLTTLADRYDALLNCLSQRVVAQATGTGIPTRTRLGNGPQNRLWLGMLASEPKLVADAQAGYSFKDRLVPPAQGFTFRVSSLPVRLDIEVSCSVYLALHPTLAEQRAAAVAEADAAGHERFTAQASGTPSAGAASANSGSTATPPPRQGRTTGAVPGHKLAPVWTKVAIDPVALHLTLADQRSVVRVGERELSAALRSASRPPAGGTLFRPRRATAPAGSLPRDHDLIDETTWSRYAAENLVDSADVMPPEHRAAIQIEVTPHEGCFEILVAVVNTTPAPDTQTYDGVHPYDHGFVDTQLYEVKLTANTDAAIVPYELEQVAKSYRYERTVPALGHASPVTTVRSGDTTTLSTQFAATERTWRSYPRESTTNSMGVQVPIDTSFDSLIADPVGTVSALVAAHETWVEQSWSTVALDELQARLGWTADARREAEQDAEAAREEVEWVRAGLELLRTNKAVLDAFVAANKVVQAAADGDYTAWRPFQVAWIVGCLPGMVDPAAHKKVNIVWFATGGGKSEAYLGLMLTTLFYGRYTGVTAGTQVWARFPLRLLALQQTERFASMVLHAELVRRDDPRIAGGDPFGLGYYVGGGNTPNQLYRPDPNNPFYRGQDPRDPKTAESCRILERCPVCKDPRPLEIRFDEPTWTMQHVCRNAGCAMKGVLPVWGVDDDVYRHAPAVLVGTVDKLAQLGQKPAFQILLGRAHSRCPKHGYTSSPLWCSVYPCRENREPIPDGFGHVRLEIADELHLLDESLGALDGMYETLLQTISEHLGNASVQIVGATATIEGYKNQVKHLYQRDAHRFPVNGPVVGETFWSTTREGDPLRRYVGVRPRVATMVTATREVALAHAAWVTDMLNAPETIAAEAGLDPTDPSTLTEIKNAGHELYEVLVAYCLRNEDLTSFTRDPHVRDLITSQANLAVINGDAAPSDIRAAVQRLTTPPAEDTERVKIIAATKAIGHGFDVARLGVMAVMGTPTQAAEIIQASARVGRRHPGIVVNIINPTRDRDASVFRYYATWIRYLDRLVHKVPVNRESVPVLKRVLSGGLMAWLLQVHDRAWMTGAPRRKSLAQSTAFRDATRAAFIDRATLIDNLTRGFGISPTSVYHHMHREAIAAWVDDQLAALPLRAEADKRLPDLLQPPVPRSLRDVEEPIVIYGDV